MKEIDVTFTMGIEPSFPETNHPKGSGIMRLNFLLLLVVPGLIMVFLLNFHIIFLDKEINVIAKDHLTLRDTFVDARDMGIIDYFSCSSRVRNHLLWLKKCRPIAESVGETTRQTAASMKKRLRAFEEKAHNWVSEKLQ